MHAIVGKNINSNTIKIIMQQKKFENVDEDKNTHCNAILVSYRMYRWILPGIKLWSLKASNVEIHVHLEMRKKIGKCAHDKHLRLRFTEKWIHFYCFMSKWETRKMSDLSKYFDTVINKVKAVYVCLNWSPLRGFVTLPRTHTCVHMCAPYTV